MWIFGFFNADNNSFGKWRNYMDNFGDFNAFIQENKENGDNCFNLVVIKLDILQSFNKAFGYENKTF